MSNLNNKVTLIGNLGKDPEVKDLQKGKKVAKFSIATSDSYKNDAGEKVTETEWHNVTAWGGLATVAEKYLSKGNEVVVEGKVAYRNYEDKDGVKKYFTEIVLSQIHLLRNQKDSVISEKK